MSNIPNPPSSNPTSQASASTGAAGGSDVFPEQRHAGKVGYGPNYHSGPGLEDKIEGLKQEIKGKITRNPGLVQHGREVFNGEEKRKKLTGEDEPNPFAHVKVDDKGSASSKKSLDSNKHDDKSEGDVKGKQLPSTMENLNSQSTQSHGSTDEDLASHSAKATPGGMAVNECHGLGAKEQAATVAPEGTHEANAQKGGDTTDNMNSIDAQN